ncbi:NADH:ubiquinone oxidoreductase subunit E [Acetoanaerobium pronyense]|uniref:NADH:ubiquinone oxidoreductase subunit E n=1 Tax=Acetoanaerobium pronyense TaxID=1482736 RepID=A0ABS4KMQ4_9FIRM|nr:(2Fe-2S) ferredoxin domain-containing protein [Acetoanaerobium pronyense]MBP2028506.1 NADH:ubiquinone oxidoreductase subunit E [Acetoanaerobium pronyense]
MIIQICIGSACHLKGSYEVISKFQSLIKERDLIDKIELKSSFCLGNCANAVSVKIGNNDVISISPSDVSNVIDRIVKEGEF